MQSTLGLITANVVQFRLGEYESYEYQKSTRTPMCRYDHFFICTEAKDYKVSPASVMFATDHIKSSS